MKKTGYIVSLLLVLLLSYGLYADVEDVPDALTLPTPVPEKQETTTKAVEPQKALSVEEKVNKPNPKPKPKKYALTINAKPADALIRNTTIKTKYRAGMKLPVGTYTIVVSKKGYSTVRKQIDIRNKDVTMTIALAKKEAVREPPVVTQPVIAKPVVTQPIITKPAITQPKLPKMQFIKGGTFQMGCVSGQDCQENESVHSVTVNDFFIGKTEVTFAQWDACVKAKGCSHHPDDGEWGRGQRPVMKVSWNDAQQYVKWLSKLSKKNYRLPTEAEWEYAARAGTRTQYSWGNQAPSCSKTAKNGASHNGGENSDCYHYPNKNFRGTELVASYTANSWYADALVSKR